MASDIKQQFRLFFPLDIYSSEAVELAAYIMEDKAEFSLEKKEDGTEVVFSNDPEEICGLFANEVLNQQCRIDLSQKTSVITKMIVARSLYSAVCGAGASNE